MKTFAPRRVAPQLSHIVLSLIITTGFLMADAASRADVINVAEAEDLVLQRAVAQLSPVAPLQRQAMLIRQ